MTDNLIIEKATEEINSNTMLGGWWVFKKKIKIFFEKTNIFVNFSLLFERIFNVPYPFSSVQ